MNHSHPPSSTAVQRIELPPLPGWPRPAEPIWFEVEGAREPLRCSADVLAGTHLLPAMYLGRDLVLPESFDPDLLGQLPRAVELLAHWFAPLHPIELRSTSECRVEDIADWPAPPPGRESACFFTGGVDSFRTLQRHLDRVDALVFVFGFDVHENNPRLWQQTEEMLSAVADETGKRLIVVRTNLRDHTDRVVSWDLAHGTALATVARLLQHELGEVLLASSFQDQQLIPWGSHPQLDEYWSTPRQRFVHDGGGEFRWQKLKGIVEWPLARQWLRVCSWNTGDTYNCGKCSKCLRTLAALDLIDAGGVVPTLPATLDVEALRRLKIHGVSELPFMQELHALSSARGEEKAPLTGVLDELLQRADLPASHAPDHLARLPVTPLRVELDGFEDGGDRWTWQLKLSWNGEDQRLRVQLHAPGFPPRRDDIAEAALVWLTPLAMHLGVPLEFAPSLPVDAELVERMGYFQQVLASMPPLGELRQVALRVTQRPPLQCQPGAPPQPVIGTAFSGGVGGNTLASSCEPRSKVLLYVHGIDAEDQGSPRKSRVEHRVREAARCHGIPVAFLDTNLRAILTGRLGLVWSTVFRFGIHGASHLLAAHINTFALASDQSFDKLVATPELLAQKQTVLFRNNHPVLFEMTSSSRVRQEYWDDGKTRAERLATLAGAPGALARIWVCLEEAKELYHGEKPNCGRCEKCLRTMCSIKTTGLGDQFEAFDHPLDPSLIASMPKVGSLHLLEWIEIRNNLRALPDGGAGVVEAVERFIERCQGGDKARVAWARVPGLLPGLRSHRDFPRWLKRHGEPLAAAVFGDKPARRALEWLDDRRGWKSFRLTALKRLASSHPTELERWIRRARIRRWLRRDP